MMGLLTLRALFGSNEHDEIKSIKTGTWSLQFSGREGEKKLQLLVQFDNFHESISRLKQHNPSMITRGC